jgi:hypothetical protein
MASVGCSVTQSILEPTIQCSPSASRATCKLYAYFLTNQHGLVCVKWGKGEAECAVTRIKILSPEQEADKRQAGWGFSGRDRACYREIDRKISRL